MRATRSRESNRLDESAAACTDVRSIIPLAGRIPHVGSSSNSGMRASRRLAPLSEASQTNQGITDFTDQTDSTDRCLTPTLPLRHEPGQILLNDLRMLSGTRRATERDRCAVVKDVVRARWTWSAADRETIRGISLIGQIRIPLVLLAATRVIRSILLRHDADRRDDLHRRADCAHAGGDRRKLSLGTACGEDRSYGRDKRRVYVAATE